MASFRPAFLTAVASLAVLASASLLSPSALAQTRPVPRAADGKPNMEGIWQAETTANADLQDHVAGLNMLAGRSVVKEGSIPYQPAAATQRAANFKNRLKDDPMQQCYLPGVPRIMYLDYPFQIFQTKQAVAFTFEWSLVYRLVYTDGTDHPDVIDNWMGDSRGHWEGDTLVVDVSKFNDRTWLDMAGDFHSDALHVVERYNMTDADTIHYEATMEDSKTYAKPWTIALDLHRRKDRARLFEYICQAEVEEANGAFTREPRTWYPGDGSFAAATAPAPPLAVATPKAATNIRRTSDDKPDLQGFWESVVAGTNQGLETHGATKTVIVDPPGELPMQPWAVVERESRDLPERGYDDPTAHCFPPGSPRSMWVPAAMHVIQTKDYIVFLHERMAWRIIPLDNRPHLPDYMRLWQGDQVGHWEGDTLVIDVANSNGKTWLTENGEFSSYATHVIERYTPSGPDTLTYQATINDPVVYTRPWTVSFQVRRGKAEMFEVACHEQDRDLPHLKLLKDAAAAKNAKK